MGTFSKAPTIGDYAIFFNRLIFCPVQWMATFKTRARTVDMLGRQQIAGIPNAVSELFKNAHDAYADRVEVDYFRSDGLFILRDDGLGMTREEFEERWLTLGTESKLQNVQGLPPPPKDPNKRPRSIAGEKGIGRLAIAIIGPQVLILTRSKYGSSRDLVACFIHWGLFECPGINLEQIEIPVRTFPGGTLPSHSDIVDMVATVRNNLQEFESKVSSDLSQRIFNDLNQFDIDPGETLSFIQDARRDEDGLGPYLDEDGHGTHFFMLPAALIEGSATSLS